MFFNEIVAALNNKFPGVEAAIVSRIADKLSKTASKPEDVTTLVEGVTFQTFLQSYGDSRATEATQTAVKNYEAKHGLKDGKSTVPTPTAPQTQPQTVTEPKQEEIPAWAKALIEANNALKEQITTLQGNQQAKNRRAEIEQITGGKISDSEKALLDVIQLDKIEDEAFGILKTKLAQIAASNVQNEAQKGATFGVPTVPNGSNQGGTGDVKSEDVDAIVNRLGI